MVCHFSTFHDVIIWGQLMEDGCRISEGQIDGALTGIRLGEL